MTTRRRGECPGVAHPLQTGDGWLARLIPYAPIGVEDVLALCAASLTHGNGILEITQRGSLQVRGLSELSAPRFAALVQTLKLPADTRVPWVTSALLGLDAAEVGAGCALFAPLRAAVERCAGLADIHPKVSALFDGGGALHLDEVVADLRIQILAGATSEIRLAGNALTAVQLGCVAATDLVPTVTAILSAIAARGADARARDLTQPRALQTLRRALAAVLRPAPVRRARPVCNPIGRHRLKNGLLALGLAFPFGQVHALDLARVARYAAHEGALALRPAAGKACLVIGLTEEAAQRFTAFAVGENLITERADPRLYVTCCAGAPACRAASVATRDWAPRIAQAAQHLLDGSIQVHLSGCAKGCGQPRTTALGFVGPNGVLLAGRAEDPPAGTASIEQFCTGIEHLDARAAARAGGEKSAALLARLGRASTLETLGAHAR